MDVVWLSRLQFAIAVFFHFIFVPLTLGLSVLLVYMQTKWYRTGEAEYKRMAKFWGKLFVINFTLGVVTGITLEFQFGTNWSRYSHYVGDIFGSLLAIEATVAFFLESTFLAVWVFGWERVSRRMHLFAIWMVALASNLSALWIILANGWMHNPVGSVYNTAKDRMELSNFWDVLTNPFAWGQYLHTILASWMLAGFFVLGVSAWHLLRRSETDFFKRSFRMAAVFTCVTAILVALQGHNHGMTVARLQPAKLAAMEAHWETQNPAPMYVFLWPDEENERNHFEWLRIPAILSFMANGRISDNPETGASAAVAGLKEFAPQDRPPVLLPFLSFRGMVALGGLFVLFGVLAFFWRKNPMDKPRFLRVLPWIIPLPYIAIMAGWALSEVGRQPWIVYGKLRTVDAVSPVPASSVAVSLVAFCVVYTLLGVLDIYLLRKYALRGPDREA